MKPLTVALSDALVAQMKEWRHHLHRHPEVEFEVQETAKFVSDLLRQWGLTVHEQVGKTGVVGVLKKGDAPAAKQIALRADMDALSIMELNDFPYKSQHDNKMHACGHDGHTAMLLGAAKHLAEHGNFNGTAYFIFQPDEEHGQGAKAMLDDGLFARFPAQAVYGMHNLPGLDTGVIALREGGIMASENQFEVQIKGVGGHASSPHRCVDPMPIAAQIITQLQTIVSRTIDPLEAVVVSITEFISDGTRNVIPSNITLKGECRTFSEANTDVVEARLNAIVSGACQAHGASAEVTFSREFCVAHNAPSATRAAEKAALTVNGEAGVILNCPPKSFSEDFAFMQRQVPGCYVFIGNGTTGNHANMLHHQQYDFNDKALSTGASYWATLVEQQLS